LERRRALLPESSPPILSGRVVAVNTTRPYRKSSLGV